MAASIRDYRNEVLIREIARRLINHQDTRTIATEMDLSINRVRSLMQRPAFGEILRALDEQVWSVWMATMKEGAAESLRERAAARMPEAMDALEKLLEDGKSEAQVVRAAELILEIGGGLDRKDKAPTVNLHFPAAQIDVLAEAMKEVDDAAARVKAINERN